MSHNVIESAETWAQARESAQRREMRVAALALIPLTAPAMDHLPAAWSWQLHLTAITGELRFAMAGQVRSSEDVKTWAEHLGAEVQRTPLDPATDSVWCEATVMDAPVVIWTTITSEAAASTQKETDQP